MALLQCPECYGTVSDRAPNCPHCGLPIGVIKNNPTPISAGQIKIDSALGGRNQVPGDSNHKSDAHRHTRPPKKNDIDKADTLISSVLMVLTAAVAIWASFTWESGPEKCKSPEYSSIDQARECFIGVWNSSGLYLHPDRSIDARANGTYIAHEMVNGTLIESHSGNWTVRREVESLTQKAFFGPHLIANKVQPNKQLTHNRYFAGTTCVQEYPCKGRQSSRSSLKLEIEASVWVIFKKEQ